MDVLSWNLSGRNTTSKRDTAYVLRKFELCSIPLKTQTNKHTIPTLYEEG